MLFLTFSLSLAQIKIGDPLGPGHSKRGPRTSSSSSIWELVRNAYSQAQHAIHRIRTCILTRSPENLLVQYFTASEVLLLDHLSQSVIQKHPEQILKPCPRSTASGGTAGAGNGMMVLATGACLLSPGNQRGRAS